MSYQKSYKTNMFRLFQWNTVRRRISYLCFVVHLFFKIVLVKVYFDFQNFHLTTRLLWPHYYTLWLVYLILNSKLCKKNINNLFKKAIYKTRYKYFRSGIIYVRNWRVCELLKCILAIQKQLRTDRK
jgi:hypothetical protein